MEELFFNNIYFKLNEDDIHFKLNEGDSDSIIDMVEEPEEQPTQQVDSLDLLDFTHKPNDKIKELYNNAVNIVTKYPDGIALGKYLEGAAPDNVSTNVLQEDTNIDIVDASTQQILSAESENVLKNSATLNAMIAATLRGQYAPVGLA